MSRILRIATYIFAVTLLLGGLGLADDDDDYRQRNPRQAQQYGYNNGFRDGEQRGRHEGREHDPFDYRQPDWRRATRGYEGWMGPVVLYQRGYQEGYRNGFRSGFEAESRPNVDRDNDYDGYQENGWRERDYVDGRDTATRWGYQDGMDAGRGDIANGKPYNPRPRGRYDDCDRGYQREFGSKNSYKVEYAEAYRRGYDNAMGRRY